MALADPLEQGVEVRRAGSGQEGQQHAWLGQQRIR
jgi:hypothetical protein